MWILINNQTAENFHLICDKSKFSVGRLDTDLILANDASISRLHAYLYIGENSNILQIEDVGSKYGVYLNNGIETKKPLQKKEVISVKDGDRIRFGVLQNIWIIKEMKIIITTSALPDKEMETLRENITLLNGSIEKQWEESCTHLTMSDISVTVKLLYALLAQIPIVTCDFWRAMVNAAKHKNSSLPLAEKFLPQRCHLPIKLKRNELCGRPERLSLFKGFTFVFMCARHQDLYGPIVRRAGANVKALNAGVRKSLLLNKNVVVIQYISSTASQSSEVANQIEVFLEENSRRIIPEFEIGLAIIYCSTEKYCNPLCKIEENLMPMTLSVGFNTEQFKKTNQLEATQLNTDNNPSPMTDIVIEDSDCSASSVTVQVNTVDVSHKRKRDIDNKIWAESIVISDEENTLPKRLKRTNVRKISSSDSDDDKLLNIKQKEKETTRKASVGKISSDSDDDNLLNLQKNLLNLKENKKEPSSASAPAPQKTNETNLIKNSSNSKTNKRESIAKKIIEPKRSKTTSVINLSSDFEEDDLFNFKENKKEPTPKKSSEPNFDIENDKPTTSKAAMARTTRSSLRTRSNNKQNPFDNIIEKETTKQENVKNVVEKQTTKTNKRPRVKLLNSDDSDDDDDLFNFNNSPKKSRKNKDDDEDDLFNFKDEGTKSNEEEAEDDDDVIIVEEKKINKKSNKIELPTPKILPAKMDISNWLSTAHIPKVEVDKTIKSEEELSNHEKWSEGLLGSFIVRVNDMSLNEIKSNKLEMPKPKELPAKLNISGWLSRTSISEDEITKSIESAAILNEEKCTEDRHDINLNDTTTQQNENLQSSESLANAETNVKNFKKFKKKNIIRQTKIVETVRVPIIYNRFMFK